MENANIKMQNNTGCIFGLNSEAILGWAGWRKINWPGVIAGVLVIALPFLELWWRFMLGTEAVTMSFSPFGVETSIFGEAISSPLFWWLCLGLKLGVVYLGVLLLTGSVLSVSERYAAIAELFVRFSARKLLWLVVAFVAMLLIVIVLVNQLPEMFGLPFQLQLPYLIGRSSVSAEVEGIRLATVVSMEFTKAFAVAVLAAALGIVAWVYQKKLL
ncbi:MAG: hypothetical protein WBD09_05405 [Halobacteriota archaeon]